MKKAFYFFISLVTFVLSNTFEVHSQVNLISFTIGSLTQGNIYSPNGVNFTGNFDFTNTSQDGNPIEVKLVYREGSTETVISSASVWKYGWGAAESIWTSSISGTLTSSQTTGRVFLRYIIYQLNGSTITNNALSGTSFGITTTPPNNPNDPGAPPQSFSPVSEAIPLYCYTQTLGGMRLNTTWEGESIAITDGVHLGTRDYSGIIGYVFTQQQPGTIMLYEYNRYGSFDYYYSTSTNTPSGLTKTNDIGYVYPNQISKTLPVYSWYQNSKFHLYTTQPASFDNANLEGIAFYMLDRVQPTTFPLPEEDTMELYEYFSSNGDHFYTTLKKDRPGFTYIKILGYVNTIQKPGTIPLYRYYSASSAAKDHYYTTVKQNYGSYIYEGIVGYVYNNGNAANTIPIHEYYTSINGDHYYNTVNSTPSGYGYYGIPFYMFQYNH